MQGCGTGRLDGLLHDVIRPFPACGNSRIHGSLSIMIVHMLSGAPLLIHVRSVGLNPWGKQSGRGGVLCARSGRMLRNSFLFLSNCQKRCMSRRGLVRVRASTWGFPRNRKSGEGVLWLGSLLGLRVSLLYYLGQAVTLG